MSYFHHTIKTLFLLLALLLALSGCKKITEEPSDWTNAVPAEITGSWNAPYDAFSILAIGSGSYRVSYFCDRSSSLAVSAQIVSVKKGNPGYLLVKIEQSSSLCGSFSMDYSYFVAGQYTVYKYSNVTTASIKFATPYKTSGSAVAPLSFSSEVAAIDTIYNHEAGYFSFMGDYTR